MFLNVNTPFSVFLCGSQGSGKSHTLSCILENCVMTSPMLGRNPSPLAGLVFHFDRMAGESVAEPAYLGSHIQTRVLVSPSNLGRMSNAYTKLKLGSRLTVEPLYLLPRHLNTERIKRLMAVGKSSEMPLYMHVIVRILRDMALACGGQAVFSWAQFRDAVRRERLTAGQNGPLNLRMDLIESFMKREGRVTVQPAQPAGQGWRGGKRGRRPQPQTQNIINETGEDLVGKEGVLTIVDLTDPVIDPDSACALFDIVLSIFVEQTKCGKVVALDEAHNYMSAKSEAATEFTNTILKNVREQRHKAVRVIVATQEPSITPALLDLCSCTIVHRFTSPAWMAAIRQHLAGAHYAQRAAADNENALGQPVPETIGANDALMKEVVRLRVGESLLFCPTAALGVTSNGGVEKLHEGYVKHKTRARLTADGGKSKMAN
ncbi:hypothetical protein BT63DRAFT_371636 [Microthyrium microscopicum]|uniref:AAA+ ATPase domain-containing protein n=1 Tax=Microthyrium microscopicum TaxID=703497 RepID=A0A6A6UFP9_9PEZI|nr:hypothetical protein BT63DRAFT_371636 [Microthyrium microscopicum]